MSRGGAGIRVGACVAFGAPLCLCSVEGLADALLSSAIPAQPLAAGLTQFAHQTGLQLVYVSDAVRDQESRGSRAGLSNVEALTALLDGTGCGSNQGITPEEHRGSDENIAGHLDGIDRRTDRREHRSRWFPRRWRCPLFYGTDERVAALWRAVTEFL